MQKTYYFNTGVKMEVNSYLQKGDIWSPNNVRLIPFICEFKGIEPPPKSSFAFASPYPDVDGYEKMIVAPIVGGNLLSKYAYFKPL
jgi:hypothetical protein